MDSSNQPLEHSSTAGHAYTARLSCKKCQERKVKCDKLKPCTSCHQIGVTCNPVERARLPRGRKKRAVNHSGASRNELTQRLDKLEETLRSFLQEDQRPLPAPLSDEDSLSPEINSSTNSQHDIMSVGDYLLYPPTPSGPASLFSAEVLRQLCQVYLKNVDMVFKILHKPSIESFLCDGGSYLEYEEDSPAPRALASSIFFAAVCSLDDLQCQSLLGISMQSAVDCFQGQAQLDLRKADFLMSDDITVLQAHVIILLASQSIDQSRRVWTMLSVVLRIAQALSLHMPDPPFVVSPFEQDMRRRLWLGIGLLDTLTSLSCGTEPMMKREWLESHPPANVNDEDIWPTMNVPVKSRPRDSADFTDITFTLIVLKAQKVIRAINFSDFTQNKTSLWPTRISLIKEFQREASQSLQGCNMETSLSPFYWFTDKTAVTIQSWLQLSCVRPLKPNESFQPPFFQSDSILGLSVKHLVHIQTSYTNSQAFCWRWFMNMWFPWHGLSVALAELAACEDPLVIERYWSRVEQFYISFSERIPFYWDSAPKEALGKLMTDAKTKRKMVMGGH